MTSLPPPAPSLWRPELPDGVEPTEPPGPAPGSDEPRLRRSSLPAFLWWTPFLAALVALTASLIGFVLITIGVEAAGRDLDADDLPPGVTLGGTFIQNIALVVATVVCARIAVAATPWALGLRRTGFWRGFGWAALAFVTFFAFSFVWALALGIEEADDLAEQLGANENAANLIAVTLLVTLAAPIAEELFFRGFLFPAVWRKLGFWPAALIGGIMFGAVHAGGTDAQFLVPLAVFGFLLCALYALSGSLLPCMALHAVNNALALGVTLGWEWWQVVLGIVAAPCVVLGLVSPFTGRTQRLEPLPGS